MLILCSGSGRTASPLNLLEPLALNPLKPGKPYKALQPENHKLLTQTLTLNPQTLTP